MSSRILAIDDDPAILDLVEFHLGGAGFEIHRAESAQEGLDAIGRLRPSVVLLDLHLPDRPGREILDFATRQHPDTPVIVLTADDAVSEAVACMQAGAFDFVQKPFDEARLETSVRNAADNRSLTRQLELVTDELRREQGFKTLIGDSNALKGAVGLLQRAAQSDVNVLLSGESGTGKEVAARALHAESGRRSGPFVAVNCGAIPENLVESELFGHEKGAFTGADEARAGRFEQADGGTLFLDELGELRLDLQVRLLRVIQERVVDRVGGKAPIPVDVRIVAATNLDLKQEVAENRFREDLFYRLAVFPVELPPLRTRAGDLELLVRNFIDTFAARHGTTVRGVESAAWQALSTYRWPGNIRELMNVIERAVLLEDGPLISVDSLPDDLVCHLGETPVEERRRASDVAPTELVERQRTPVQGIEIVDPDAILPFETEEKNIIRRALDICEWNVQMAAKKLQLGRATVYRKIEKYRLSREEDDAPQD